jgi:hypothetical protein
VFRTTPSGIKDTSGDKGLREINKLLIVGTAFSNFTFNTYNIVPKIREYNWKMTTFNMYVI